MEKSKLGISITLFSALLYFLGASGSVLVAAIATGYVLLYEENETLKRTSIKALILIIFLELLATTITFLTMMLSPILNTTYSLYLQKSVYNAPNALYLFVQFIPNGINSIVRIIEIVIPVIFGFLAYKQKDIKIKWIDKILDKHFG